MLFGAELKDWTPDGKSDTEEAVFIGFNGRFWSRRRAERSVRWLAGCCSGRMLRRNGRVPPASRAKLPRGLQSH
jgi:hypothetical protein